MAMGFCSSTVMPGDNTIMTAELQKPTAMTEGLRLAIREGGRTVGGGRVSTITKYDRYPVAEARREKIRMRLTAYDHETLNQSTKKSVDT